MATNLEVYGYDYLGQSYREKVAEVLPDATSDLREKALAMAIEFQRTHSEVDVVKVAAEFLAFLKGGSDV